MTVYVMIIRYQPVASPQAAVQQAVSNNVTKVLRPRGLWAGGSHDYMVISYITGWLDILRTY